MTAKFLNKISHFNSLLFTHNIKIAQLFIPFKKSFKTSVYSANSNIILDKMTCSSFKFTDFDCIGFDLDNTLCRYKIGPVLKMEYEVIAKYLVNVKKYPGLHLNRPIEEHIDFLVKGLIIDCDNGNMLKIGAKGKILQACHGTKHLLTREEIEEIYTNSHWPVSDVFVDNPLTTWNGPLSGKIRSLLDYFDMPVALIFARLVDTLDEEAGKKLKKYNLYPDIISALVNMYDTEHFASNEGGYFPILKANPDCYIEKCSDNVTNWLKDLKKQNKILFLLTGSHVDFASFTAKTSMGDNWSEIFDIVIFYAKKPGFFTENEPFVNVKTDNKINCGCELEKCGWYTRGNWKHLYEFLSIQSNNKSPRVAYIGDHLLQDVYTPALHTNCETVAIIKELEAEGIPGFSIDHEHLDYLVSERWGSFFGDRNNEENFTFWLSIIKNYSKLCVPSVEYIASKSIDFDFNIN